jgi:hypothetical protein
MCQPRVRAKQHATQRHPPPQLCAPGVQLRARPHERALWMVALPKRLKVGPRHGVACEVQLGGQAAVAAPVLRVRGVQLGGGGWEVEGGGGGGEG